MNTIKINNQKEIFIHLTLQDDEAYIWSVKNNDPVNMQLVLRAYSEEHDFISAEKQIKVATEFDA